MAKKEQSHATTTVEEVDVKPDLKGEIVMEATTSVESQCNEISKSTNCNETSTQNGEFPLDVSMIKVEETTSVESTCNEISTQNGDVSLANSCLQLSNGGSKSIAESNLVTDKMLEEERKLEENAILEEQKLKQKILEEENKMAEEQRKAEEEKCFKRLHLLLSRSSIYAKFMVEKLQTHERKQQRKQDKANPKSVGISQEGNGSNDSSPKCGTKRKTEDSSPRKKCKPEVSMLDVFKKENMENIKYEQPSHEAAPKRNILESQPDLFYGGIMRPYQLEGFDWLKTLFENGVNGILADEMGLGKTIQCIAFISYLVEMGVSGPFFVCGPLSTVPNWYAEFQRFTPDIPVMIYHGEKAERHKSIKKITKKVKVKDFSCCPVVITSYSIALNDVKKLQNIQWKMLVIDEAHRIKNFQCKLVEALKRFNAVHRLLLTGTPLQNDLTELWSLLNFILPEIFSDLKVFESWFDITRLMQKSGTMEIIAREQEKHIVSTIHQILTPFLLRRIKSDVELDLPPKKEVVIHAPLTELQQEYYTSTLNHVIRKLFHAEAELDAEPTVEDLPKRRSKQTTFFGCDTDIDIEWLENQLDGSGGDQATAPPQLVSLANDEPLAEINLKLSNCQMCLRKICNHPYLVSYPLDPCTHEYLVDENIVTSSGKLLILDCLLPKLKERGHKVLLFSQFVTMLEILIDYCNFRNYKYCILHGSKSLEDRQEQIKSFNEDPSIFIFLISTRAGGLGINLTAADTVVLYDSDWNPQGDLQAQDRCHRIGQTKPVVVYRLLVPNTIDSHIMDRAVAKRKLEKVIIKKGRFASKDNVGKTQGTLTKEELLELLEFSDAHGFVKTDTNQVISPEELENILDRSDMITPKKENL